MKEAKEIMDKVEQTIYLLDKTENLLPDPYLDYKLKDKVVPVKSKSKFKPVFATFVLVLNLLTLIYFIGNFQTTSQDTSILANSLKQEYGLSQTYSLTTLSGVK